MASFPDLVISFIFSIITKASQVISLAFMVHSLYCVYKYWNIGKNKEIFNSLVLSTVLIIFTTILNSIFSNELFYDGAKGLNIAMIMISILVVGGIYFISENSGHRIYGPTYFSKLQNKEFAKEEILSSLAFAMEDINRITNKVSEKRKENEERKQQEYNRRESDMKYKQENYYADDLTYEYSDTNSNVFQGYLKEDRSLLLYIILSIITCGLYSLYFIHKLAKDTNIACHGDGEKTGGLLKFFLLTIFTCGIYSIIWQYNIANRLAANGRRYGYDIQENGTSVLLWLLFGIWFCGLGHWVATNIIISNLNKVSRGYNQYHRRKGN